MAIASLTSQIMMIGSQSTMNEQPNGKAFVLGFEAGEAAERERIINWVKENRREFEIDDGVFFYRDSFNSEDLLKFIDGKKKEDEESTGGEQS
jgi:hypothetical protein